MGRLFSTKQFCVVLARSQREFWFCVNEIVDLQWIQGRLTHILSMLCVFVDFSFNNILTRNSIKKCWYWWQRGGFVHMGVRTWHSWDGLSFWKVDSNQSLVSFHPYEMCSFRSWEASLLLSYLVRIWMRSLVRPIPKLVWLNAIFCIIFKKRNRKDNTSDG